MEAKNLAASFSAALGDDISESSLTRGAGIPHVVFYEQYNNTFQLGKIDYTHSEDVQMDDHDLALLTDESMSLVDKRAIESPAKSHSVPRVRNETDDNRTSPTAFSANIFPSHSGAASYSIESPGDCYHNAIEYTDGNEEESVLSMRKMNFVSHDKPNKSFEHHGTINQVNDNIDTILASPSLDLIEKQGDLNSSGASVDQFSYISNGTEVDEQLDIPPGLQNDTLTRTTSGDEKLGSGKDMHDNIEMGDQFPKSDPLKTSRSHSIVESTKKSTTAVFVEEEEIQIKTDDRDKIFDSSKQLTQHQAISVKKALVQYSDKQTERIRAKESQIRAKHRERRKKARLGLQAQENRGNGPLLHGTNSRVGSSDAIKSGMAAASRSGPVNSTLQSWRKGKTRRKPVYDGEPDSSPGVNCFKICEITGTILEGGIDHLYGNDENGDEDEDEYPKMNWSA